MSLRADPSAMAPERLLVFELKAPVASFAAAIKKVNGLELIDEEELSSDQTGENPITYLLVPDVAALRQIESLWRRSQRNESFETGWTAWRDVFALLRDLRPWGPKDRVDQQDADLLQQEIDGRAEGDRIHLEVELVFRSGVQVWNAAESSLIAEIQHRGGHVIARSRIADIAYHALLLEIPVAEVRKIIAQSLVGIAGIDSVMHIRPQSLATTIALSEPERSEAPVIADALGTPILALLDGVPMARHRLLSQHLVVHDLFDLEPGTQVPDRSHGTAMASLIVHGDRNAPQPPLPRKIHMIPVLQATPGAEESFPESRLIVDVIYRAIRSMREGIDATALDVLIVNLSLGNRRQPFYGRLSAWAKLLDRLAYAYGILFVISAGNIRESLRLSAFGTRTAFEDAEPAARAAGVLGAMAEQMGARTIIAPAESVNGITIGACNEDAVAPQHHQTAALVIDPYANLSISNPSSALGPGYAFAVKPDLLMPGSRERLRVVGSDQTSIEVKPAGPSRAAGLKVAAPPSAGEENFELYTDGTSAAAALASRTCHRIHDALEAAYSAEFLALPSRSRAVLLKALLAHNAYWPPATADMIRQIFGPVDAKQHVRQKDNIRRLLGYGIVDAESAVACADDRATFWAVGEIKENQVIKVPIPVPVALAGKARPHSISATMAWFTPTQPGTKAYRSVRLTLMPPEEIDLLGVKSVSSQPDSNQCKRGTLSSRRWEGSNAPAVTDDMNIAMRVQREPDQGSMLIDDSVPFGLAVTITMPGVNEIYEEVRLRLGIRTRVLEL